MLAATAVNFGSFTPTFKCDNPVAPGICYGVGTGTDSLFRSIQVLVNYYSSRGGFSPITIDGKLGANTVAAVNAAGRYLLQSPSTSPTGNNLVAWSATYQSLAQNAVSVQAALQQGISADALPAVSAPVAKTLVTGTAVTPPLTLPTKTSWKSWTIGAVVVAAAGFGAYYILSE
jgi:lysozyme family protein